jgi:type IV secretory pathway VirB2 component (pilin)
MSMNATSHDRRRAKRDALRWARPLSRYARPVSILALCLLVCAGTALAQTGNPGTEPPDTNIDIIVEQLRNFIITVLMPLIAALAIVWACFQLYSGGREGMGNMLKVVAATLAALGAVGLVELLKAFAGGQPGR